MDLLMPRSYLKLLTFFACLCFSIGGLFATDISVAIAQEHSQLCVVEHQGSCDVETNSCGNPLYCLCPDGYVYNAITGNCLIEQVQDLPLLKLGITGTSVKLAQQLLKGFHDGGFIDQDVNINGSYDKQTEDAVKNFQTNYRELTGATLPKTDGQVGPNTWNALGEMVLQSKPNPAQVGQ